jgi:U32 family peptidase
MTSRPIPELLAPAGSLDAVRAAVANGANAVYLGAARYNARDDGAQLTLDELEQACQLAHQRGARVYLTFNVLIKPGELVDALVYLGECIDRGIDAAIVQDLGAVRLIQAVYPKLEIHGSTQMTVHDASGAALMRELGVDRVVLARENTLDDIRAIRAAEPDLGLETFVHGALCISYSGQCFMSGMISERSANRGSCAQSCRKDYVLADAASGETLDAGYLISAKDLAAHDHLADIAAAGVGCLKVEGRKKKPEYVATVTRAYRGFLDALARGERAAPTQADVEPLVQIYSRGFTGGMYGGRAGRSYITREQPDNRGEGLGVVVACEGGELIVELSAPVAPGDGLAFEPPDGGAKQAVGFAVPDVRTLRERAGVVRQAIPARARVPVGSRVVRSSHAALLERARASYESLPLPARERKTRLDARIFGTAGSPLKVVFATTDETVAVRGEIPLVPAAKRSLDQRQLREQLGRLGDTPFALGSLDDRGLAPGLFLPVSELNHLRQRAADELLTRRDWAREAALAERRATVERAVLHIPGVQTHDEPVEARAAAGGPVPFALSADVFSAEAAKAAAAAGATEITLDPFLRHPAPPASRVRALADELSARGTALRLRTPTIVRPDERRALDKWLALELPLVSGHLGLIAELSRQGRDVVADYAVNCFNQHTAAEVMRLGARRIVLSVELTAEEMAEVVNPWGGRGFDAVVYGRPEGMTIEHCVLSAAFDRVPTTCRDLCVQKHTNVELTDPAGYTFPVATDSACRNRLLHSRPIDASEYLPRLWDHGIRAYRLLFNVPGDPVSEVVAAYRSALDALAAGSSPQLGAVRALLGGAFTRGHFARAV